MMLAINKNSFHYKFFMLLRKMWNIDARNEEHTSLCYYSQFIFWMTILTAITSPIILLGWFVLKLCRFVYKLCSFTQIGRSLIDLLEKIFGLGEAVDKASNKMKEAPAINLIKVGSAIIAGVFVITFISVFVFLGVVVFISVCMNIPEYIGGLLGVICLAAFYICSGIGFVLFKALSWILFVLKWLTMGIVMYVGSIALIGVVLLGISLLIIAIVKLFSLSEGLRSFFGFKINGFHKAKEDAEQRRLRKLELQMKLREEREKELLEIKRKKERGEIPLTGIEKGILFCINRVTSCLKWCKEQFVSKKIKVKGGSVKVIRGIGVIWEILKSIKNGICPLVKFIDANDIEDNSQGE